MLLTGTLAIAACVAAWWIVGPQHERGGYIQIVPPIVDSRWADLNAGVCGLLFVGGLSVALFIRHRRRPLRTAWWVVLYLYGLAGVGAGAGGRWVTAKTNGANIGGGLILIGGVPSLAVVLTGATWWSLALLKRERQPYDPGLSPTELRLLAFGALGIGIVAWTPLGFLVMFFPLAVTAIVFGGTAVLNLRGREQRTLKRAALSGIAVAAANIALAAVWLFTDAFQ